MHKYAIRNGQGHIEIPTVEEFTAPMNTILAKLGKNAVFRRVVQASPTSAAGAFTFQAGPNDGFLWAVVGVAIDTGNTTGTWQLYYNSVSPLNVCSALQTGSGFLTIPRPTIVLKGNDVLIAQSGAVASAVGYNGGMRLDVIGVPYAHEAQLLL